MSQPTGAASVSLAAVVLTGGTAVRLGGTDKASLEYAGQPMLERVLDALVDCSEVVVAGPPTPVTRAVTFAREDPPLGGPVAGLLAGRRALRDPVELVAVVAVDMPRLTPETIRRLRAASAGRDGAVLVGADGRRHLAAVLRLDRLDAATADDDGQGLAWRRLLGELDLAEVAAVDDEGHDVDTWSDLV
ncbi:MAG: molybdenum cofactor guanylyltransferase [Nocardioides sp.]|uniref:molybdenum cofactor guanylyltransferase n=1 Tax=Nocardioides sp. TaxID=35761 RepID=UPI0039E241C6